MGFTKIYKQTSPDVLGRTTSNPNLDNTYIPSVQYTDWTGTTYTGFWASGFTGSSSPYTNHFARNTLLIWQGSGASAFTLPSTVFSNTSSSNTFYAIGSGSTAESEDDYHLDNPLVYSNDFTASIGATAYGYDSDTGKTYHSKTITITAAANIIIREIGLYQSIFYGRTSSTAFTFTPPVLMYRKVLPQDISLSAGQSVTIELRIAGG